MLALQGLTATPAQLCLDLNVHQLHIKCSSTSHWTHQISASGCEQSHATDVERMHAGYQDCYLRLASIAQQRGDGAEALQRVEEALARCKPPAAGAAPATGTRGAAERREYMDAMAMKGAAPPFMCTCGQILSVHD